VKHCKAPTSLTKGVILFSFEGLSFDDGTSSVEAHEWVVRSVRTKRTNISECGLKLNPFKRDAVFVNISSKKKGVTWIDSKWAKYISADYKKSFILGDRLPEDIYTTSLQALKYSVKKWGKYVAEAKVELEKANTKKEIDTWSEEVIYLEKELKLLKGRLTRMNNQKLKSKAA
jgi:hypothetical protein